MAKLPIEPVEVVGLVDAIAEPDSGTVSVQPEGGNRGNCVSVVEEKTLFFCRTFSNAE